MAEVLDETLTTKAEKTTHGKERIAGRTTSRTPRKRQSTERSKAPSQEAAGTPANSNPGKVAAAASGDGAEPGTGIERLIEEADKALGEDCMALAQTLAQKAKNGSDSAVKLLVMLAERKKPRKPPVKKPKDRTFAQGLSRQSRWEGGEQQKQSAKPGEPGNSAG